MSQQLTAEQREQHWQEFCTEIEPYLRADALTRALMRIDDYLAAESRRKARGRRQTLTERWDAILRRAEERVLLDAWLDDEEKIAAIERILDADMQIHNRHVGRPTYWSEFMFLDLRNRIKLIVRSACGDRRWRSLA